MVLFGGLNPKISDTNEYRYLDAGQQKIMRQELSVSDTKD
jgi:hypothetical protein